ncbi:uncharacterized protein LOC110457489 isoform X3 [Mizuhopecten yessoensis]|uniref:uncharacterized protein LOC110457489 isoform X3 n=1 Tax=Mizuhopecten yessoensis TaxID=6573 RepID=UPI000B459E78|nr:uncharacterized protein LOC110457489 isoform X3 [Mizuhopecten yessoensis]
MIRAFSQQIHNMAGNWRSLESILRPFDTRIHPLPIQVPSNLVRASVLVPLFWKNGEWRVMLTIRASSLRTHSGVVAFPGGKQDDTDEHEIAAALRESNEEVGLNPEDVRVLAVLPPSFASENILVTPVASVIPNDFVPKVNEDEVRKVFDLPLSRFLTEDYTMTRHEHHGGNVCLYYFTDNIDGETVKTWGYTATIAMRVAMVILDSDVSRELKDGFYITKENSLSSLSQSNTLKRLARMQDNPAKL